MAESYPPYRLRIQPEIRLNLPGLKQGEPLPYELVATFYKKTLALLPPDVTAPLKLHPDKVMVYERGDDYMTALVGGELEWEVKFPWELHQRLMPLEDQGAALAKAFHDIKVGAKGLLMVQARDNDLVPWWVIGALRDHESVGFHHYPDLGALKRD